MAEGQEENAECGMRRAESDGSPAVIPHTWRSPAPPRRRLVAGRFIPLRQQDDAVGVEALVL